MSKYSPEEIQENRKKWVQALRSGKYTQTIGTLCRIRPWIFDAGENVGQTAPAGYCCLGVAVETFHTGVKQEIDSGQVSYESHYTEVEYTDRPVLHYWETSSLTTDAQNRLGLTRDDPVVKLPNGDYRTLTDLNDDARLTFSQIAAVIEDQDPDWDGGYNYDGEYEIR